jgi:hypothetical protein
MLLSIGSWRTRDRIATRLSARQLTTTPST